MTPEAEQHDGDVYKRQIVTCVDRINVILRPLTGGNPVNPPQIQNQAGPFPFLGYLNLGRADTLYYLSLIHI